MKAPTADQVRQARHAAGHSQRQAALKIGVDTRTWQNYESGKTIMDPIKFKYYQEITKC